MNKYKYLLKNIGILTISNFGTKILSFILIPLYTSVLTTAEYGTYDFYSSTVSLLVPILTLNVVDSVMRFSLDKETDKKQVFSVGFNRFLLSIVILLGLILINEFFSVLPLLKLYRGYFILLYISSVLYNLLSQFCRGMEKITVVAIAGILNSLIMLLMNVFFLVTLKIGLDGYFLAYILSYFLPCIYLFIKIKCWRYISLVNIDNQIKKEMLTYSKPLIFNTIAWWINNVSDRYIVTWMCGVAANGVYSIAYKIPSVLNIFQSIFSQAWTLSAVKEFSDDNSDFYSKIYTIYNVLMIMVCSVLIILDKIMAKILFAKGFYEAWKYAPFLMISVIFGALSGFLGGIFTAVKETSIIAKTTIIGAIVNTVLNLLLVSKFGPIGAAITTLISYVIVWSIRLYAANRIVKMNIYLIRDILCYLLLIIQSLILLFLPDLHAVLLNIFFTFLILFIQKDNVRFVILKLCRFQKFN